MLGSNRKGGVHGVWKHPPPSLVLGKTVAYYICKAKLLKIGHTLLRSLPHVYITWLNKPWV